MNQSTIKKEFEGNLIATVLTDAIFDGLEKKIGEVYEHKKREMIEAFDRDKNAIISGIVLDIKKQIDIQTSGDILTIRIKTESK